jgi:D-ribose pyranase
MKKTALLNQPISAIIAGLGHRDTIVIADAGLPIPEGPVRIDLALTKGTPSFLQTLEAVLTEMQVERAIIAEEMLQVSADLQPAITKRLGDLPVDTMSHEEFKERICSAKAVIRTGQFTPYANIILVAGVVF